MNINRFFLILCLLLFLAGGGSVIHAADSWDYPTSKPTNPFAGGDGSKWNPYRIDNAQQLANFSYMVTKKGENYEGKYFVLTNDITLNDDVLDASGKGLRYDVSNYKEWTPIGDRSVWDYGIFKGIFDGQGHTIRGMVCAKKNEREYTGLFETIEYATIKNINMEDCCIKDDDAKSKSNFGILCGEAWNTCTISNCTISKSAIIIKSELDVCVGGILGSFRSIKPLHISNCSFNGYISFSQDDYYKFWFAGKCIGGILGFNNEGKTELHFNNCSSSGDIDIYCSHDNEKYYYYIGGLGGNLHSEHAFFSNCVSSMNINIDSPNSGIGYCNVGGIVNYVDTKRSFSNCVYLGTIRVGSAGSPAKMEELKVCGIGGSNYVNGCAFYGKMDIHCKATHKIQIAGITIKHIIGDNYKQNIVYSAGNVIDIDAPTTKIDPVCNEIEDGKKHKDFYCFGLSNGESVDCKYSYNPATYNKSLDQMMADDLIKTLNKDAGSNVWGKMTGMSDELNGLPMPIACGGDVTGLAGQGTDTDPFLITCEAELRALQRGTSVSSSSTDGRYFKLTNDIYMSSEPMPAIGSQSYPFKGTFDGGGHAIVGMVTQDGYLFDALAGTLQNLALVDFKAAEGLTKITPLAQYIGGNYAENGQVEKTNHIGKINNCYVTGDLNIAVNNSYYYGQASGICGAVFSGSSVSNCYFKGSINVSVAEESKAELYICGGVNSISLGAVNNCYASYSLNAPEKDGTNVKERNVSGFGLGYYTNVSNCYYVRTDLTNNTSEDNCLATEKELNAKFSNIDGWSQGLYRPVLTSVKSYVATLPNNGGTKYLDAVPEPTPKSNYIINVTAGNDPYADKLVWQLPNTAVYVESEKTDYILNCTLDQSDDFNYTPKSGATATKGQLRYDLTQTEKGYHLVCLPGVVEKSDLPEGTKVMIVGNVTGNESDATRQVNVVMVEDIPAGVPCFVYVPTTTVTQGKAIPLVMRSGIVSEPQNETYGSLKGTFVNATKTDVCVSAQYNNSTDKLPYFIRTAGNSEVKPFSAWLEGANGDVKIVDYILLDEENEAMTVTLSEYNAKTYNIKMRRALKKDKWNTICLPYSLSSDEISSLFGSGTKVETFDDLEYNSETNSYTMKFIAKTEITAGTPYLIKPSKDVSDNIYEIKDRTITCTSGTYVPTGEPQTANNTTLTMQGEYNKRKITPFDVTESENIYVINGDKIYHVNSNVEMKGFRCYFVAKESTTEPSSMFSNAKVIHSDGTSTDLRLIDAEATGDTDAVYDLLGRKRNAQTKGLVIKNGIKVLKN